MSTLSVLAAVLLWTATPWSAPEHADPAVEALRATWARAETSTAPADAATEVRTLFAAAIDTSPPDDPGAVYLLRASIYAEAPRMAHVVLPVTDETTTQLVDCAGHLQAAGDHQGAIHLLETVLSRRPHLPAAHLMVADSRMAVGDVVDAKYHYERYLGLLSQS